MCCYEEKYKEVVCHFQTWMEKAFYSRALIFYKKVDVSQAYKRPVYVSIQIQQFDNK